MAEVNSFCLYCVFCVRRDLPGGIFFILFGVSPLDKFPGMAYN